MSGLALIGGVVFALIMKQSLIAHPDVVPFTERLDGRRIFDKILNYADAFSYHAVASISSNVCKFN